MIPFKSLVIQIRVQLQLHHQEGGKENSGNYEPHKVKTVSVTGKEFMLQKYSNIGKRNAETYVLRIIQ